MAIRRPSKYQPIGDFLAAQPPGTVTVTLSVPEIEALVGQELPLAAHVPHWWMTGAGGGPARVWLRVGWRVSHAQVRQAPSAITFVRVAPESTT